MDNIEFTENEKLKDKIINTNFLEYCNNIKKCQFYWCGSCCISCFFLPYIVYINTKKY